jgi:hypothetical protein
VATDVPGGPEDLARVVPRQLRQQRRRKGDPSAPKTPVAGVVILPLGSGLDPTTGRPNAAPAVPGR